MSGAAHEQRNERRSYVTGYVLALALTAAAFAIVRWHVAGAPVALIVVFALGLAQMIVHFRFFLHISLAKSARDDLQLILFSGIVIALMVSGTLVILFNLRRRMM
jgi:cytochrome o ubiquinol oxidase operon protein cyoD